MLLYIGISIFVLIGCIFCGIIMYYMFRKQQKLETQLFHVTSRSSNTPPPAHIPKEGPIKSPNNKINSYTDDDILSIASDQVIAFEVQKHEHDISNELNGITKMSNDSIIIIEGQKSPHNTSYVITDTPSMNIINEGTNVSELNDKIISIEYQRSQIDRYDLTKGNISENETITPGNK